MEQIQKLTKNEIYAMIDLLNEQKERFLRHKLGLEPIKTLATDLALADFICELLENEIVARDKKEIRNIFGKK